MPPSKRAVCQVCRSTESKYTCSRCTAPYCSVLCYKEHKGTSCLATTPQSNPSTAPEHATHSTFEPSHENEPGPSLTTADRQLKSPSPPLRPLTSLKWPYIPEESAYPDPLKRDDPKTLQLHQYEEIATSQAVRNALASNPRLPEILRSIDSLRGEDREDALQRALGISASNIEGPASYPPAARDPEDIRALRALAEAVEAAVRGGKEDVLGLDWGD